MKHKKSIKATVKIKAQGTQLSRFLSLLLARDILYQNARYEGSFLTLELPARQYRAAVSCAKKAGVRVRIESKKGLYFFLFRHRRRKWLLLILLPLLIGVGLIPRFIWTVEMEGLNTISQMEMLRRLEEAGLHTGMWKSEVDALKAKEEILLSYPDLSWLSISVEGTVLKVAASEAVMAPEMMDRTTPCDVVADRTCVIYSMVTESGTPQVMQGDVVREGDILIRGEVTRTDDDGNKTVIEAHAAGDIYGKRSLEAEEEIAQDYDKQIWSSDVYHGVLLRWGQYQLELKNPFRESNQEAVTETALLRLPFLPDFCVSTLTYEPYVAETAQYTEEEMQQRLEERLERKKAQLLAEGGRVILEEELRFEETEMGMKGILELTLMEPVGQTVPHMQQEAADESPVGDSR